LLSGHTDSSTRQQWLHLVESQERCLQVFRDYSEPAIVQAWLAASRAPRCWRSSACAASAADRTAARWTAT
jgi:hypothetical protein